MFMQKPRDRSELGHGAQLSSLADGLVLVYRGKSKRAPADGLPVPVETVHGRLGTQTSD